jgi:pimeloyl-ACP methyl ester carboxylesterase
LLATGDLSAETDLPLLFGMWEEAARIQPEIDGPQNRVKARTPAFAQRALYALARSRFFAGLSERALIGDLKQVSGYMNDESIRDRVCERIVDSISDDTRVLIGHSLGSVVAYEVLASGACTHVKRFVSLGSPLGIPNLVFDRLRPAPCDGWGAWPGWLQAWTNVSDRGDIVALEKNLAQRFKGNVRDVLVDNGAKAHDVHPYLTAVETGAAVLRGLNDVP